MTGETPAEKTGYRWMMKCLRALDAKPRTLARMRDVVADDDHLKVIVAKCAAKGCPGGMRAFRAEHAAAAKEAIALLQAGSFACGFSAEKPGDGPYPNSFKIVITVRRY